LAEADTTAIAYLSPAQQRQALVTAQTDLWGWGLTVLEMFVGQCTWADGTSANQALDYYLEHDPKDAQLPRMPVQVAQLLQRCFQDSPGDRCLSLLHDHRNIPARL